MALAVEGKRLTFAFQGSRRSKILAFKRNGTIFCRYLLLILQCDRERVLHCSSSRLLESAVHTSRVHLKTFNLDVTSSLPVPSNRRVSIRIDIVTDGQERGSAGIRHPVWVGIAVS